MLGSSKRFSVIGVAILASQGLCWTERMKIEGEKIEAIVEEKISEQASSWWNPFNWLSSSPCPESQICDSLDDNYSADAPFLNDVDNESASSKGNKDEPLEKHIPVVKHSCPNAKKLALKAAMNPELLPIPEYVLNSAVRDDFVPTEKALFYKFSDGDLEPLILGNGTELRSRELKEQADFRKWLD